MGVVQKVVRNTVAVPARGVKRIARLATEPMRAGRKKRSAPRRRKK
jgi:hypothetical protein